MRTVRLVFTSFSAYPDLIKSWLKPSHWKFFPVSATVQLPLSHLKNLTFICAYYVSWLILRSWIPSSSSQGLTFHLYILHTFFLKDDGINFTEKYLEVREGSWKIVCDLRCFISSSCFLQNFFFFFCSWYMYQERIEKDKHSVGIVPSSKSLLYDWEIFYCNYM